VRPTRTRNLVVTYRLEDAEPDHAYTVGVHFYNRRALTVDPGVHRFAGTFVGHAVATREGRTAFVDAWDFGTLTTDDDGDGTRVLSLSVPAARYTLQFTVRHGACPGDCAVSYRTGTAFAAGFQQLDLTQRITAELTPGWDDPEAPLDQGFTTWTIATTSTRNLAITYTLLGALPNHTYTVGSHFFNRANPLEDPRVDAFGGTFVGKGVATREGNTAFFSAWDYTTLTTNGSGDGAATVSLNVPLGTYSLQNTVRLGACPSVDCTVVYRTGDAYADGLTTLIIR
jgi:hypothetical protein